MDIPWEDARLFFTVVDARSVSRAAKSLGITQPTASRRLAQLEARLGEPLFRRSVQGVALTPFGERLVDPARRMAEWASELERAAARRETVVAGVVRITAPPGLALDFVAPFAALLRKKLPEIRLEVLSGVRVLDLTRREADLALRVGKPPHRELTSLCELALRVSPFAAARYVARLGPRPKPSAVDWIGWAPPFDDSPPTSWLARHIAGFAPSFSADDFLLQYRAAELGLGAILLGRFRHRFTRSSPLVQLDVEGLPEIPSSLHLVCAKTALDVPRIRAVAELLRDELAAADTT